MYVGEQALSSPISNKVIREGRQKKVPNCGEGVRTVRVRAVCLVAHQGTDWAGPARTLFGGSRIAVTFARAC